MKYILLYLVLGLDELPDLEPPTMKCKPKQQQVSSSDDDDDDDIIFIKEEKKVIMMKYFAFSYSFP